MKPNERKEMQSSKYILFHIRPQKTESDASKAKPRGPLKKKREKTRTNRQIMGRGCGVVALWTGDLQRLNRGTDWVNGMRGRKKNLSKFAFTGWRWRRAGSARGQKDEGRS